MARILPTALRSVQKGVGSLGGGLFNGHVEALMLPVDTKALTFNANVKIFTGNTATPSVEYTPCDDNGNIKKFSNIDDLVNWVKGAYTDIATFVVTIADFDLITNKYKSAVDPLKQAVTLKAKYLAAKTALDDNLVAASADVTRAAALGWNLPEAHAADKANYNEFVAQKDAIVAAQAYYNAQVAKYQAIITP